MTGKRLPLEVLTDFMRERREWTVRGNCHGMGSRFTGSPHSYQKDVCYGKEGPRLGAVCPVINECFRDILVRRRMFGSAEINEGDVVAGGMTPAEQRRYIRSAVKAERAEREARRRGGGAGTF